jgi:hypothetical protein
MSPSVAPARRWGSIRSTQRKIRRGRDDEERPPRHLDRVHVPQLDLFRPASAGPNWWQLPAKTRERVLRLMTRLLRERRNGRVHALTIS